MPIVSSGKRRHRSKIGGCISSFSHLFDWSRILGNKTVASAKLLQQDFENSPAHINFQNPLFQEVQHERTPLSKRKLSRLKQLEGEIEPIRVSSYRWTSSDLDGEEVPMELRKLHDLLNVQDEPFLLENILQEKKQAIRSQLRDTRIRSSTNGNEKDIQQARRSLNLKKIKMNEINRTRRSLPPSKSLSTSRQPSSTSPLQFSSKMLFSPTKSPSGFSSPAKSPIQSPSRRTALLMGAAAKILEPNSHYRKCLPTVRSLLLEMEDEPAVVVNDRKREILDRAQRSSETLNDQTELRYLWKDRRSYTIPSNLQQPLALLDNLEEHRHENDCSSQSRIFPETLQVTGTPSVSPNQSKVGIEVSNHRKEGIFTQYGRLFGSNKEQKKDERKAMEHNAFRYSFWRRATSEASAAWIIPGSKDSRKGKTGILSNMGFVAKLLPRRKQLRKHALGKDLDIIEPESTGCSLQQTALTEDAELNPSDFTASEHIRDNVPLGLTILTDGREVFSLNKKESKSQPTEEFTPVERPQLQNEQSRVDQELEIRINIEEPGVSNAATEEEIDALIGTSVIKNDASATDIEKNEISYMSVETKNIPENRCQEELQLEEVFSISILASVRACPLMLCDFSWWKKEEMLETDKYVEEHNSKDNQILGDITSQQWSGSPHHINKVFQNGESASFSEAHSSVSATSACLNDIEQSSPVSVLEVSFEEDLPGLEKSLANFEEVKRKFLEKVQTYELLGKMDLSLLEKYVNEQQDLSTTTSGDSSSSCSPVAAHRMYDDDMESEDAESLEQEEARQRSNEPLSDCPHWQQAADDQPAGAVSSCGLLKHTQSCQNSGPSCHFLETFKRGHRDGHAPVEFVNEELESPKPWTDSSYILDAYVKSGIQKRRVMQRNFPLYGCQLETVDNLLRKEIPSGRNHWKAFSEEVEDIFFEVYTNIGGLLLHELLAEFITEFRESILRAD